MRQLANDGKSPRWLADSAEPARFPPPRGRRRQYVIDAAYRFVRHEPGVDVVLFGTGDPGHLRSNIASILKPPLPETDRRILARHFGHLVGIGLDPPVYMPGLSSSAP